MPKFNMAETRKKAESSGVLGSGDYLKLAEGDNRVRLMSECLEHPGEFNGKRTFKWLCYVLDRKDGKIKPYFMPHSIYTQIEALQLNPDYTFEEVPMPYDITLNAKGAGTKEVKYTVVPARQNTPLMGAELTAFREATPIRELQRRLQEEKSKPASEDVRPSFLDDDDDIKVEPGDLPR